MRKEIEGSTSEAHNLAERDTRVASILGTFLIVLALPVLAGSLYVESTLDLVIELVAGALLLAVGLLFLWTARRSRPANPRTHGASCDREPGSR